MRHLSLWDTLGSVGISFWLWGESVCCGETFFAVGLICVLWNESA